MLLDVCNQLVGGRRRAAGTLDDCADRLAETLVWDPDSRRVHHRRVRLEGLLHLFGEDLLTTRIDHNRSTSEQVDSAVVVDRGVVARHRVALAVENREGTGGLLG